MNTLPFETADFVCSKCSAFSALADVVGLSLVIKCPLCNEIFLFSFFKKKKRKKERCHGRPVVTVVSHLTYKKGAFVAALRRPLKTEFVLIKPDCYCYTNHKIVQSL